MTENANVDVPGMSEDEREYLRGHVCYRLYKAVGLCIQSFGGGHTASLDFKMSSKSSSAVRLLCNEVSINLANERSSSTCFIVSCATANCCSVECDNPLSGANLDPFCS